MSACVWCGFNCDICDHAPCIYAFGGKYVPPPDATKTVYVCIFQWLGCIEFITVSDVFSDAADQLPVFKIVSLFLLPSLLSSTILFQPDKYEEKYGS